MSIIVPKPSKLSCTAFETPLDSIVRHMKIGSHMVCW